MNFLENFACQSVDGIQRAYWNSTTFTLLPEVVYYKVNEELNTEIMYLFWTYNSTFLVNLRYYSLEFFV